MPRHIDPDDLVAEWQSLPKNWYSIYQWPRTARAGYVEYVASLILDSFNNIELVLTDLRQAGFRVSDHRGQAKLQTDIAQFTEKRFCRALFNLPVAALLGKVIDYEVPLKGTEDAPHGDIDLLCVNDEGVILLEAKKPSSNESILRPILQAFVYSSLVANVRRSFLDSFLLPHNSILTPAILTFSTALSGRQLATLESQPKLLEVIHGLNHVLRLKQMAPLRFFVVQNDNNVANGCLMIECCPNGDKKVIFRDGYVPTIVEHVVR